MNIFSGVKACVLYGFAGFTKVSGEIISRNINREGGIVLDVSRIASEIHNLDCIIVPESAPLSKLLEVLKLEKLPSCPLVTPSWAIDSIKLKNQLPMSNYQWANLDLPQKRINESTEISDSPTKKASFPQKPLKSLPPEIIRFDRSGDFLQERQTLRTEFLSERDKFEFSKDHCNQNSHITSVLEVLMNNYQLLKDRGRMLGYRSAIIAIGSYPHKITCAEQVENLEKVGKKIKKKIGEILETGTLKRVQAMEEQTRLKVLKEFCNIWGVGNSTANKLFSLGYRSINDLRANVPDILNINQRIALELHEEISEKIPRAEVKQISDIVVEYAQQLIGDEPITANTCGSYRRGREKCGDIDILLTFDDISSRRLFLSDLVSLLQEKNLITHTLVLSEDFKKHENLSFEGIAKLPGSIHRRLDIKIYPKKYYAWALMHFTGSANFNRSIRLFAKKKGLKLTDEGIFPAIRTNGETYCGPSLAICHTEEDIFKLFDMDYKSPEERDI